MKGLKPGKMFYLRGGEKIRISNKKGTSKHLCRLSQSRHRLATFYDDLFESSCKTIHSEELLQAGLIQEGPKQKTFVVSVP